MTAQQAEAEALFLARYQIKFPRATDDYSKGCCPVPLERALSLRYIQANPGQILYQMVLDVDQDDSLVRALDQGKGLPMPSWVAQSPNGHAHAGYMLRTPVHMDAVDQRKAASLAARVEAGLRTLLPADPGYSGLLTKNPIHPDFDTWWGSSELHTLAGMAAQLGTRLPKSKPHNVTDVEDRAGLGRNCLLFEEARHWAYSAWPRYSSDTLRDFIAAILGHLILLNAQLPVPLPASEVKGIAASIGRWTWRKFSPRGFSEVQQRRGRKSGKVRTARALQREQDVLRLRAEGWRWQVIADSLGMSLDAAQSIARRAQKKPSRTISDNAL